MVDPLLVSPLIDAEIEDDVNVGILPNKLFFPNRFVDVIVTAVVFKELDNDAVATVIVNNTGGNTYDPLVPTHSLALLALLLQKKYSPDAELYHIAPPTVGFTVIVGLLAVVYVTGFDAGTWAELDTVPAGSWAELLKIPTGNNVVTCADPDTAPAGSNDTTCAAPDTTPLNLFATEL